MLDSVRCPVEGARWGVMSPVSGHGAGDLPDGLAPDARTDRPDTDLHHSRRKGPCTLSRKDSAPYPGWLKETNR